ncbi:MAG: KpsF/GutQ family sugar-phosphate isomerase [Planctomycetes bacterium]|nr:KpsF/GutQ family sugar-phosphate isomerase [Planctomycetota bacterium]
MKVERASVAGSLDRSKERLARAAEVLRLEARTIAHLEERLGPEFLRAVELVLACEGHVVLTGVGKAGLVGQKISATLASTGTPSIFLHPTEAAHGDLGRIRKRDLVFAISNSGETVETNSLIGPARRIGVKILALTGVANSTLARISDCVLDIGEIEEACPLKLAPTASTSAMLAMGDALAMVVSQERNFGREEYALYHPGGMLGRKLMRVFEVMRSGAELPLLDSRANLADAIMAMNRTPGRPGAVLLVDAQQRLAGIFTHGDLARLMETEAALDKRAPIDSLMGKHPKSIGPDELVEEATRRMKEHRVDQIAVIDAERRPIGLLDVQDLLDVRV